MRCATQTSHVCAGPGLYLVLKQSSQRLRNSHVTYAGAGFLGQRVNMHAHRAKGMSGASDSPLR